MAEAQEIKGFNRIVVVGPSRLPELQTHIDTDRYGDWAASIFHGYLNPKMKSPQVYIIGGSMNSLEDDGAWTVDSTQNIAERLQTVYRVPSSTIVVDRPRVVDFGDRMLDGSSRRPGVFRSAKEGKRELGLVVDSTQRDIGQTALSGLNIQTRIFELRPPKFGEDIPENLIDFTEYVDTDRYEEQLSEAGDA